MNLTRPHDEAIRAKTSLHDPQLTDSSQPNQTIRPERNRGPWQEEDNEEGTQKMDQRKGEQHLKQPSLDMSNELPQDIIHLILASEKDNQNFFHIANHPDATLRAIRRLDIHLDTKKLDEYAAYRLALALAELHPRSDGQNPHQIHTIRLVVDGKMLLTRYSYHLASPAGSDLVGQNLKKFLAGGLTQKEKARLAFKLNSTETIVAKALIGIRGVARVIIDGKGKMEGCFAETLKATLIQPPGTAIVEVDDPTLPYSTSEMNRVGPIVSATYAQAGHLPYPTLSIATKYDFSSLKVRDRRLVDERPQILHHLLNLDENEDSRLLPGPSTTARSARRLLPEFDVSSPQPLQKHSRKRKHEEDGGLGMEDMVRIRAGEQGNEPVEFGWKI